MAYVDVLIALADPTRRNIFETLWQKPRTVTDLAADQTVSRSAVSQHLKMLEAADLVHATPQGRHRLYAVRGKGLDELRNYLDQFWTDALGAYAAEVQRRTTRN